LSLFDVISSRLGYTETDSSISIPKALERAEALGLAGVEINLNFNSYFPETIKEYDIKEWRAEVDNSHIELSFHGPVDISLISRHQSIQKAAINRLCEFIELAVRLGGKRFTFHPGRAAFMRPSQHAVLFFRNKYPQQLVNAFLNSLTDVIAFADGRIKIFIENTHTPDKPIMDIIRRFAQEHFLSFAYDTAHSDHSKFLADHTEFIKVCHLNDRQGDHSHIPLGSGEIDFAPVIELLARKDCFFIIEAGKYESVRQSVEYLKSI